LRIALLVIEPPGPLDERLDLGAGTRMAYMLVISLNFCDWRRDISISGAPLSLTIKAPSKLCSNAGAHRRLMMRLRPARKKVVGFKRPTR
jgi:hypothetical protein